MPFDDVQQLLARIRNALFAIVGSIDAIAAHRPHDVSALMPLWKKYMHDTEQLLDELADALRGEPDEEE